MKTRWEIQRKSNEFPSTYVTIWSADHRPTLDEMKAAFKNDSHQGFKYRLIQVDFQGE